MRMYAYSMPQMSVGSAFIMAAAIVVALVIFIGIVLFAGRRPYFKRQKPTPKQGTRPVTGGVHEGDPRSVSPRRDEAVRPRRPGE
jgi:hypothetical protein